LPPSPARVPRRPPRKGSPGMQSDLRKLLLGALVALAVVFAGCGGSAEQKTPEEKRAEQGVEREVEYGVAQEVIEEEGFSSHAAEEARETAEREGIPPREAAEMGAAAKQLGH
jgi:hypothetical protein